MVRSPFSARFIDANRAARAAITIAAVAALTMALPLARARAADPEPGGTPAPAADTAKPAAPADGAPAADAAKTDTKTDTKADTAAPAGGAGTSTRIAADTSAETTTAGVPMVDAAVQAASPARYGFGVRTRWTSVPKWLLGLFLDQSVPLSSYTIGGEFFRRSGNFDFVVGLAWQSLSPNDGNWLGKGNSPVTDTDFVQFRGLGAVSVDAAFILRTDLNEYVVLHYGGGVGVGIVTGKMLRTSDGNNATFNTSDCSTIAKAGSVSGCHPALCATGPCTENELANSSLGGNDGPTSPSRFQEGRVPTAYPIVNLVTGLDFKIPSVPGLEIKAEGGYFFPYFFLGGGVTYRI